MIAQFSYYLFIARCKMRLLNCCLFLALYTLCLQPSAAQTVPYTAAAASAAATSAARFAGQCKPVLRVGFFPYDVTKPLENLDSFIQFTSDFPSSPSYASVVAATAGTVTAVPAESVTGAPRLHSPPVLKLSILSMYISPFFFVTVFNILVRKKHEKIAMAPRMNYIRYISVAVQPHLRVL